MAVLISMSNSEYFFSAQTKVPMRSASLGKTFVLELMRLVNRRSFGVTLAENNPSGNS